MSVSQPHWYKPKSQGDPPKLVIYNTLTRSKNEFIPKRQGHISWYCCGPTVYDHSHMGHARNYVSTDISRRILQDYFGYNIKFVQNVTDIDDKIIVAARHQYLFEEKVTQKHRTIDESLTKLATQFLDHYVKKYLPQFEGSLENDLLPWISLLDLAKLAVESPKLPMYTRAASRAHVTIFNDKFNGGIDQYFEDIKEVAAPFLDKEYGSTVNDPSVFKKLPAFWEARFNDDMARLNVLPPTVTTRVSEYIPEIIEFVDKIIANGFAYTTNDGSVYFDTVKFENDPRHDYAKLQPWSKGDLTLIDDGEGLLSTGGTKKTAADFALWKASKPGEPSWESKWGLGRPGWHIECSVMASDITGDNMDIHAGGIDLCFPHHDNELAQSEACFNNQQWVNYFMHNGHLHIQGQKMSKSLKNFITVEEALNTYSARQLRLVFASSPWERPLDFKDSLIKEVKSIESTFSKFFTTVRALNTDFKLAVDRGEYVSLKPSAKEKALYQELADSQDEVHRAFSDNLSSSRALRVLVDLVSKTNSYIQSQQDNLRIEAVLLVTKWITKILDILGFASRADNLGWSDPRELESAGSSEDLLLPYIRALSSFRDEIRNMAISKLSPESFLGATDAIRSQLVNLGISLDDRPNGDALIKFLDPQEKQALLDQQEAKDKAQAEKQKKKEQQAAANAKKEQERLEKLKISPAEMFKDPSLYSAWDEEGIPTKDASGEEITKSMRKKLTKQYQQQQKLYEGK